MPSCSRTYPTDFFHNRAASLPSPQHDLLFRPGECVGLSLVTIYVWFRCSFPPHTTPSIVPKFGIFVLFMLLIHSNGARSLYQDYVAQFPSSANGNVTFLVLLTGGASGNFARPYLLGVHEVESLDNLASHPCSYLIHSAR